MKEHKSKIQKWREILQNGIAVLVLLAGVYLYFQYSEGLVTEGRAIQLLASILIPLVAMELVGSLVTGQAFSKGVIVNRESTPRLFYLSNLVTGAVLVSCIFGVIHYE